MVAQEVMAVHLPSAQINLEKVLDLFGDSNYHDFAARGRFSTYPSFTAWELYRIKGDPSLCAKTTFYERGSTDLTPSVTAWQVKIIASSAFFTESIPPDFARFVVNPKLYDWRGETID